MYVIGLDIGTTHIKAVLIDKELSVKAIHIEDNQKYLSQYEQWCYEPEILWNKALKCIKSVIEGIDGQKIIAIAVTSMAESGVLLDQSGNVVYPIIPWNDIRTKKQIRKLENILGGYNIYKKTGQVCHPKYTISRLMWIEENHGQLFETPKVWLSVADYIVYKLSGEYVTDSSLACRTMLYNITKKEWDKDLCRFINKNIILPEVVSIGDVAGVIKKDLSREIGLKDNVKIVIAGHDHLSAAVAVGINNEDEILDSMGTSEVFAGGEDELDLSYDSFKLGINQGCFVDGKYYWMTSMPASGASVEWIRSLLSVNGEISYEIFTDIDKYKEATSIYYFPYLNGSGTPHVDCLKMGMLFGLSGDTDIYKIIKAIYEGTAYESRWIIESIEKKKKRNIKRIKAVGGGTQNLPWIITRCNVLGKNIICSSLQEAAASGAALLAARSAGLVNNLNELSLKSEGSNLEVYVDSEVNKEYNRKFETYKNIYYALEKIYESGEINGEGNENKRLVNEGTN